MRIKQNTIDKYRSVIDDLIIQGKLKEALELASKYPLHWGHESGYVICKTRLLKQYLITNSDIETLNQIQKNNPHYKLSSPMILFLEYEVKLKFNKKPIR